MNERIQELLHQCSVPNDQAENYSKSKGLVIPDQKLDVAKFAELIVAECADWIDGSPSTDAGQLVLTKSFIIANIKDHFGVE